MPILRNIRIWAGRQNWDKVSWLVAIEIALLMVTASFILPGGDDFYRFYLPFSGGCLQCGFIPYFAQWVLWPLAHFPIGFAWSLWTSLSLIGWLGLCRYTRANPALVLLSFPAFGQFWLGQIDILVCVGLALALLARNPYGRGVGIALALIKPQLSGITIFFLLSRERELLKVLVVPVTVLVVSLVTFGVNWPLEWLVSAAQGVPIHQWRLASIDFWPIGLLLIWIPFWFDERQARFEAATLISVLATPFVGVYSYMIFLVFSRRAWWTVPLSYIWLLAYPFWNVFAMRLAWILPVTILLHMISSEFKNRPRASRTDPIQ